jgi:hypothetical protein
MMDPFPSSFGIDLSVIKKNEKKRVGIPLEQGIFKTFITTK